MMKQKSFTPFLIGLFVIISGSLNSFGQRSVHRQLNEAGGVKKADLMLDLANSYIGVFPDSVRYYTSLALREGKRLNSVRIQSRSYAIIADSYQHQQKFKESIEYFLKSIELSEKHQDKKTLCSAYNGLGITYYYLNDMAKAEHYIQLCLKTNLEEKNYVNYSIISSNLGALYFYKGEYRKAIDKLIHSEKTLKKYHQDKYLPSLYNSIGGNYRMLEKPDSAAYYYTISLQKAKQFGVIDNVITAYHNLGDLCLLKKDYTCAIDYLKQAETESKKAKKDALKLAVYTSLSEAYELSGDYKSAYKYKTLQFELNNKLFAIEKQKAIDELDIKYEAAKKEKKIQHQKQLIQQSKLKAEREQSIFNIILFSLIIVFIIVVFSLFFFWQRKYAKQLLEQEKLRLFENIVHDIRTPLTLINGPLQLVKKEMEHNDALSEHFQLIEANSEKLGNLVNELLDVSKLEKGKYLPAYEYGNVNLLVEKIVESFRREAKNKKIELVFEPVTSKELYSYPANVVEKVVSNLVSNAIKYCPDSSKVHVKLEIQKSGLIIDVTDNGPGIPEQEQALVFTRFYRMKQHENLTGTGIGLALVKELIELVHGNITLISGSGGASFRITIPVDSIGLGDELAEMDESKPYLLLVEDDRDIVQFVSGLFRKEFNVIPASNGEEGLKKINLLLPDVILTDVMMPVKDGIELIQEVKGNPLTNHIPVVVFSAKASLESRLEGLKHGADVYFPKPFNTDELVLTIQNLSQTSKRNQQEFQQELKLEASFEERTRSKSDYVNQMIAFIVAHLDDVNYSVNELAGDMCISRSQLHRKLKVLTGFSSTNFIRTIRLEKAKDLLSSNWGNVTEVAYACGFSSQSYFTKAFTEYFGENPSSFVK